MSKRVEASGAEWLAALETLQQRAPWGKRLGEIFEDLEADLGKWQGRLRSKANTRISYDQLLPPKKEFDYHRGEWLLLAICAANMLPNFEPIDEDVSRQPGNSQRTKQGRLWESARAFAEQIYIWLEEGKQALLCRSAPMKRRIFLLAFALSGLTCARADDKPTVAIFAAASLKEIVSDRAGRWGRQSGYRTQLQFESSSTLARQIQQGAQADIFISAAPEWLDQIKPIDRYDWLSNRLVCVVAKDTLDFDIRRMESLAIGNEQVPAGKYGRAALAYMGVVIPARTIYGSNVRDVLSKVVQGGAQAGIVYATDAAAEPAVKIAYIFAPQSHSRITYAVGLVTPRGRTFFEELRQPATIRLAVSRGFIDLSTQ